MFILASGTLYKYGLNRIFEIAKELGFDGVEIFINDIYDTYDSEYIGKLIESYNLPVVALRGGKKISQPGQVKKLIELAEELNIPNVILRVPYFTDFKFTTWFKNHLPKLQDKTKVKIAVENVPSGNGFILPEFAMGSLYELKRFQYICLDTSHLVSRKTDLMRAYQSVKKQLAFIHLSNWHKGHEHWMLQEGILPIESFLTKLAKDGYEGPISLKLDLSNIGDDNLKQVLKNLKKCKDFFDTYFRPDAVLPEPKENAEKLESK